MGGDMNVSLILGHPDPGSFNHAIAGAAREELERLGHGVAFHDLIAEGFDPVLPAREIPKGAALPADVAAHCAELAAADGIVVVHPNWWGMPPAVLKGWIDRVVRCGVAYEFEENDAGEGVPVRLLTGMKAAVVLNTGNTPIERELAAFGDPLERIWKDCIFGLCANARFYRRLFTVICLSSPEQRRQWLEEVRGLMREVFGA
jgi:putative NADPH-quinone reductase